MIPKKPKLVGTAQTDVLEHQVFSSPAAFELTLGKHVASRAAGNRGRRGRRRKTKYSQSGLPLDPALADVLYDWKHASQFGQDGDWVFASSQTAGELPLRSSRMLERQIKPAAEAAQLGPAIGWHTFRHTYSSMLRQLGVDLKVQQELLRHADIRITMNVYTQTVSEQKRSAHSSVVRLVLPLTRTGEA